jgi:cell division protein FtsZ
MTLFEVDEAANRIREEVDPDANIIFGSTFDEKLAGRMRISVVATGIDAESALGAGHAAAAARPLSVDPALRESGYTQPILTQNAAAPRSEPAAAEPRPESAPEPAPAAAAAAESAALRNGAFIAPRPVDAGPARPLPVAQAAVPPAAHEAPPRARGRVPSLIERVTGVGRSRASAPAPDRTPRPAAPPPRSAPPRLTPLEPEEGPGASKEDDLLDIPAFLRRQAN